MDEIQKTGRIVFAGRSGNAKQCQTAFADIGKVKEPSSCNSIWQATPGKLAMNPCSLSGEGLTGGLGRLLGICFF